jgi:hypothetical protein
MIVNGLLVAGACYASVRPVFVERVEQLKNNEARMELMYLGSLFGLGPLISTLIANAALPCIMQRTSGLHARDAAAWQGPTEA